MEWADLTEEYMSGLLNTDSLLSPDVLIGASSTKDAASETDSSAASLPAVGENTSELLSAN